MSWWALSISHDCLLLPTIKFKFSVESLRILFAKGQLQGTGQNLPQPPFLWEIAWLATSCLRVTVTSLTWESWTGQMPWHNAKMMAATLQALEEFENKLLSPACQQWHKLRKRNPPGLGSLTWVQMDTIFGMTTHQCPSPIGHLVNQVTFSV